MASQEWLCVTCPHRERGICRALLGSSTEESAVRKPSWQQFRTVRANENIVMQNDASEHVYVLCGGWAFRFLKMVDLPRQILSFLLPGDVFSPIALFENHSHSSVQALTAVQVSRFERAEVRGRLAANPRLLEELARSCSARQKDADEFLTVLGRGSAEKRIAYLFLYLMRKVSDRTVIRERRFSFPLRHQHIAEFAGLTPVHVSRVIKTFRDRGLIELSGGVLAILDLPELERIGALK